MLAFECLAAVLRLACLAEAHACDAPEQQHAAECLVKAGMANSDHQLAKLLRLWHAVAPSAAGGTTARMGIAVEAARCPEGAEAEAVGTARQVDGLH